MYIYIYLYIYIYIHRERERGYINRVFNKIIYSIKYDMMYNIRQTTAMNKRSQQRHASRAGLAWAPLLPLLLLLWYFIHSCSLPFVVYYLIFGSISYLDNNSTSIIILPLIIRKGTNHPKNTNYP